MVPVKDLSHLLPRFLNIFFLIYILEWRREEGEAVHWGHKNRWQSAGCKGELPAKCITSHRRKLPFDLISEGRGKRKVLGKS